MFQFSCRLAFYQLFVFPTGQRKYRFKEVDIVEVLLDHVNYSLLDW